MFREGKLICDTCQTAITRVVPPPADGWPHVHDLCPSCFQKLREKS